VRPAASGPAPWQIDDDDKTHLPMSLTERDQERESVNETNCKKAVTAELIHKGMMVIIT